MNAFLSACHGLFDMCGMCIFLYSMCKACGFVCVFCVIGQWMRVQNVFEYVYRMHISMFWCLSFERVHMCVSCIFRNMYISVFYVKCVNLWVSSVWYIYENGNGACLNIWIVCFQNAMNASWKINVFNQIKNQILNSNFTFH